MEDNRFQLFSMFSHNIRSSPLDGLQNNLRPSNSVISFDSILTNSRLLDKLDLSKEDESILLEEITRENNNANANNKNLNNVRLSDPIHDDIKILELNKESSKANIKQNTTESYILSLPASQFPSLKLNNNISIRNKSTNQNDIPLYTYSSSKKIDIINNDNTTSPLIKNILSNITFNDKSLQSRVEQHYSNTSRYSYIVEEDTDSIRNLIIENIPENNTNPMVLRRQNLSTKSNISANSQFSKASLQLSSPLTHETTNSELQNIKVESFTLSSPNLSPTNESKPPLIFSKSHKKKNSLSSLKNLLKKNKNKSSPEQIKRNNSNKDFTNEPGKSFNQHLDLKFSSSNYNNVTSIRKTKSSSKLIFSPQPQLSPQSNSLHVYEENSYQDIKKHTCNVNSNPTINSSRSRQIPSPTHKNLTGIASPIHKRSISAFNHIVPLTRSVPSSPVSSTHKSAVQNYVSSSNLPQENGHFQENSYSKDKILISAAIDMRKAGNLHASALKLRQACQKGNKTAFLLYGLALRYGYGVEIDYIQSFYYIKLATSIKSWDNDVFNFEVNPFQLERTINESIPFKLEEPLVPALFECGIAYLKGYGIQNIDEYKGLKCLEKAASMGHVDSMCLSGIIWSQEPEISEQSFNSTSFDKKIRRKKDVIKAAAWFRIAEKRGANLIGSDWIYKKKYLKAAKNR